ncbi:polysaccharide deacetylase family protein [Streptomyces misionensis]|uniref:Polysaccharide deacetylase family protein n=1 Tax=Streptomyces misionensis TaxID=67331 RepID=A0A5C6JRE2_9ACTN|nr:polysaccharide deacetylase family protein [Streptomyces misionensis]TWV44413.1 polysaccharide deacetylase family protein [Streptomyces misionensis]
MRRGGTGWAAVAAAVVTVVGASVLGPLAGTSAGGAAASRPDGRARAAAPPAAPAHPGARQPVPGQTSVPEPGLPAPVVSMDIAHASDKGPRAVNITIDDGPDPVWTPRVLKVLKDNGARAVFCMIGSKAAEHPDVVRQVVAAGHRLCDHSVHHDTTMDHRSRSFQYAEVTGAARMIEQASGGVKPQYYRAPGGAFTPYSRQIAASAGMRPLGWNVDSDDYKRHGVQAILNTVERELPGGPTILFHDGGGDRSETVAALAALLPRLKDQGYAFGFPVR